MILSVEEVLFLNELFLKFQKDSYIVSGWRLGILAINITVLSVDYGMQDGQYAFVLKYIEGKTTSHEESTWIIEDMYYLI